MSNIKKDITETISTFFKTIRPDKSKDGGEAEMQSENESVVNQTRESVNKLAEQKTRSQTLTSVSRASKPQRPIYVNKSTTVKVMEPKEKDDTYYVIDELKAEQTVMVKLNSVEPEVRRQILDLIYGACRYANLIVEKVDAQMILIDPNHS